MNALFIIFIIFIFFLALWATSNVIAIIGGSPPVDTSRALCAEILRKAGLSKKDVLLDLGSGSGNTLIATVKDIGATAIGYEISPFPYLLSRVRTILIRQKVRIHYASLFEADLSGATVVFIYLLPKILRTVGVKLQQECDPGTLIISRGFPLTNLILLRTFTAGHNKTKIFLYKIK
ncbi:MAG TPA: hypothetical protein PLC05_01210 [bacterium]|nr:hypothetical protein [bacterium]HPL56104.1 hypothetical protein [bacterium]